MTPHPPKPSEELVQYVDWNINGYIQDRPLMIEKFKEVLSAEFERGRNQGLEEASELADYHLDGETNWLVPKIRSLKGKPE